MTASQRRLALGGALLGAAILFFLAYRSALTPATHPDHDHGILDLDAGGNLSVTTRTGSRNLVGAPGKVLVVSFFDTRAKGAADELRSLFAYQASVKDDPGVEFVLIAREREFGPVDAFLAANGLVPPVPASVVLDTTGDTTTKFNSKRPVETMFFGPTGKLASQARGSFDWGMQAQVKIAQARGGTSIE